MKKIIATIALFVIGTLWYTVGKESGYTIIGLIVFGLAITLVVALWNKKYAQSTKKLAIGFIVVSIIGVIILPILNLPIKNTSTSQAVAFKEGFRDYFVKTCNETDSVDGQQRCACMADYMLKNYTESQITQMNKEYNETHDVPLELKVAASSCVSQ